MIDTQEELATLEQLIARAQGAKWDMIAALYEIENRSLYYPKFTLFYDFLFANFRDIYKTEATWRQHRASYEAYIQVQGIGVTLKNEYAARKLRACEKQTWQLVVALASEYAEDHVAAAGFGAVLQSPDFPAEGGGPRNHFHAVGAQ